MWRPVKIEFNNLFAHHHTEYGFKNNVCTVIFGENLDAEDCDNNGAGKSTIFEAIAIALTNKSLRDLDKEAFINRDAEDCDVALELKNDVLNSSVKIMRKFFRGNKPVKVQIIENGKLNTQITSVNEANKRIYEIIGISREDLLRYYIISQDNSYTFFKAGDVEKKEVLNRITSADMINPLIEKLSEDKKEIAGKILELDSSLLTVDSKIGFFKEQRANNEAVNDDYEIKTKSARIEEIKTKRKQFEINIKSLDVKIKDCSDKIKTLKDKTVDVSDLKERRKKLKNNIDKIDAELSDSKSILRKIMTEINGVTECPNCHYKFIQDSEFDLTYDEAVSMKKDTESLITDYENKILDKKTKLSNLREKIANAEKIQEDIENLTLEAKSYSRRRNTLEDEIKDATEDIQSIAEEIKKIKAESKSEKIRREIDEKLKSLDADRLRLETEKKERESELNMVNYWIYYMGKNGFTTYLANRAVSIIGGITNSYLRKFYSNLLVDISGFKILKDGSVREKIDVKVFDMDNRASTTFMGCSGGERGRVSLAGVLGIQNLINLSLNGRGLDLLLLDETFHGVDSKGQENMIKILENIGSTILMITQNVTSEFNSNNKILIQKKDGVAKIVK